MRETTIFRDRSLEERKLKYEWLMRKNPNKIPVIFERN